MRKFRYTCVSAKNKAVLNFIIDNAVEITHDTFEKNVSKIEYPLLQRELGYTKHSRPRRLKDDYAVSFFKSKLPNKTPVYFFKHSGIEYIFY